jgi:hypothetical protein
MGLAELTRIQVGSKDVKSALGMPSDSECLERITSILPKNIKSFAWEGFFS